jgi:hypothetical protein
VRATSASVLLVSVERRTYSLYPLSEDADTYPESSGERGWDDQRKHFGFSALRA